MMTKKTKAEEGGLDSLAAVAQLMQEVKSTRVHMDESVNRLERGWEAQMECLRLSIETKNDEAIVELREEINTTIKGDIIKAVTKNTSREICKAEVNMNSAHTALRNEVDTLRMQLAEAKQETRRISERVGGPYNPDKSLVIYGLRQSEDETLEEVIVWLLKDVLEVDVKIVNYMRTMPKSEQGCGVIKVELDNVYKKMSVVKNKSKCAGYVELQKVTIRTCDSHEILVNKTNTRFLLSQLCKAKDFIVTSNGLIRKKINNQGGGAPGGCNGGDGHISNGNTDHGNNDEGLNPDHGLGLNERENGTGDDLNGRDADRDAQRSPIQTAIGTASGEEAASAPMGDNGGLPNINNRGGRNETDPHTTLFGPGVQIGHRVLTRVNDVPAQARGGRRGRGQGVDEHRGRGRETPHLDIGRGRGILDNGGSPVLRAGRGRASPRLVNVETAGIIKAQNREANMSMAIS